VGLPRTDLKVVLDGVELKPTLALGPWLAFRFQEDQASDGRSRPNHRRSEPGDEETGGGRIEITASHNHLFRAAPATFYLHVRGHGDPVKLATALQDGLLLSKTPLTPSTVAAPSPIGLDTALIDRTLGAKGKVNAAPIR
jgi:hypothetical protein